MEISVWEPSHDAEVQVWLIVLFRRAVKKRRRKPALEGFIPLQSPLIR